MEKKQFTLELGGRELVIETGKLAQQTNGSCTVRYGGTVVLATAVISDAIREGMNYFPLMVDYEEKLYAAGKIKGSRFIKRETRPSDDAVTIARMIDRSLRPLFHQEMRNDIQVITTTLSWDGENDTDIVALIAASCAVEMSDIPFDGPMAGVRVGQILSDDGTKKEWVLNPTYAARLKSTLDLIVVGNGEKVVMIEAEAKEAPEADVLAGIEFAQKHIKKTCDLISEVRAAVGKQKMIVDQQADNAPARHATQGVAGGDEADNAERADNAEMQQKVRAFVATSAAQYLFDTTKTSKLERKEVFGVIKEKLELSLREEQVGKEKRQLAMEMLGDEVEHAVTQAILKREQRVDGRRITDIRPLAAEVGLLPRTHGTALFQRGDTQVLSIVTLGSPGDQQIIEGLEAEEKRRYMHHYNFPPFSVGEVKPLRGASRRDIGHGALAEKAIVPMLPEKEAFPYTIRVVSEVLSSNGSSSMASVCGSSMALMDAGVPLKKPVAGIAMGLASDETGAWKVLTDLQDMEDGQGGMDFKIAGTDTGITAIQLDTKTKGLTMDIVEQTLKQGHEARLKILATMGTAIAAPRPELSQYAPRIVSLMIDPEKIRVVIGPGGKMINEIIDKTGVDIDIEDSGLVMITSTDAKGMEAAVQMVKDLTREVVVGEIFKGKVTRLMDFGAFVEVLPKQEGLVHISELAPYRVNLVTDIVKIGMEIPVKVIEIDEQGRINLSLKQTDYKDYPPAPAAGSFQPRGMRPMGGGSGPRGSRGGRGGPFGRPRF